MFYLTFLSFQDPHNCTTYQTSLCANVTMTATAANLTIEKCDTRCCPDDNCNAEFVPTVATTEASTATGATVEAITAAAQVFRPELIAMSLIALMAVFFGLQ